VRVAAAGILLLAACAVVLAVHGALGVHAVAHGLGVRETAARVRLSLELEEPADGTTAQGWRVPWRGRVVLRAPDGAPARVLERHDIAIVPLVRPRGKDPRWWVQGEARLRSGGRLEGDLALGEPQGRGVGVVYDVLIVAVPRGSARRGDVLAQLPFTYATSQVVAVRRLV